MSASEIQQLELPFSSADKVQMLEDSNRHLEIENEALREENAMLRRMLFGKKSEKLVHENIGIEEVDEVSVPAPEKVAEEKAGKQSSSGKKKRRLFATITKEIEQLLIPEEVLENPLAYTRLPESSDRISRRLEYVRGHFEMHIFRMPSFVKKGQRGKSGQDSPIHAATPQSILPGSTWAQASSHWPYITNTASTCRSTAR